MVEGRLYRLGDKLFCATTDGRLYWCTEEAWQTESSAAWKKLSAITILGEMASPAECEPECCEERDVESVRSELIEELEKGIGVDLILLINEIRYAQLRLDTDALTALEVVRVSDEQKRICPS